MTYFQTGQVYVGLVLKAKDKNSVKFLRYHDIQLNKLSKLPVKSFRKSKIICKIDKQSFMTEYYSKRV